MKNIWIWKTINCQDNLGYKKINEVVWKLFEKLTDQNILTSMINSGCFVSDILGFPC